MVCDAVATRQAGICGAWEARAAEQMPGGYVAVSKNVEYGIIKKISGRGGQNRQSVDGP